ncbi:MAG: hypothetical protein LBC92_04000, partial [Rickettsiales bacterium]|nr:hypothetical protein [Rickettsiales bacterium]
MNALFIHDHIFYTINGNHYSQGGLPSTIWSRYLKHFDSLTVIARGKKAADNTGLVLSSAENVEFNLFYSV